MTDDREPPRIPRPRGEAMRRMRRAVLHGMGARELVEVVTSRPGYTSAVGTRVVLAEVGHVHLALDRRPDLVQFNGFFHGGVLAGIADHAAGAAVTTALPDGRVAVTLNLHVNFVAPADGDRIIAKAKALRVGGTVSVAAVEVTTLRGGDEHLCAVCTATMRAVDFPTGDTARPRLVGIHYRAETGILLEGLGRSHQQHRGSYGAGIAE